MGAYLGEQVFLAKLLRILVNQGKYSVVCTNENYINPFFKKIKFQPFYNTLAQ